MEHQLQERNPKENPEPSLPPQHPPPPPPPPLHVPEEQAESIDDSLTKENRPLLKINPTTEKATSHICLRDIKELEKKYAPFVRCDVYGPMGCGTLSWPEKVLLGLALPTLVPIRLVVGITILVLYYMICKACTLFSEPNGREDGQEDYAHMQGWRRRVIVSSGRFLSRVMLFVFGFYWMKESFYNADVDNASNTEIRCKYQLERPGAVVSNHVSYMDILYHMSSSFPSFVAKRSVAKIPLLGLISKCLGCIYVQRESKSPNFKGVSGIVTERVREAHENKGAPMMMLFPEGTTTNGDFLLPFKTGAFLSKVPVFPVILRYPYQRFNPAWESMCGARHVFFLLCQFVNYIEVTKLPVYYPSQQEKDDPKLYAENVRRLMSHEGNLILSDIGLDEKRVYLAALNGFSCQQ